MTTTVPGVPNPIRFENVVENYRALQKTKPEFTFEYGLKSMLTIFTLHDFSMFHVLEEEFGTELMEIYFDTFGNPIYLAEKSEDRYTFRVTDCPYTTEVLWKMYSPEENLAYNDKIQVSCNTAIFDTFMRLTGLDKDWTFGFPAQLCRSGGYCEFTFVRKHF
jgi:hypothetical protein